MGGHGPAGMTPIRAKPAPHSIAITAPDSARPIGVSSERMPAHAAADTTAHKPHWSFISILRAAGNTTWRSHAIQYFVASRRGAPPLSDLRSLGEQRAAEFLAPSLLGGDAMKPLPGVGADHPNAISNRIATVRISSRVLVSGWRPCSWGRVARPRSRSCFCFRGRRLRRGEEGKDGRMSIRAATRFQSTAVAYSPWNESSLAVGSAQHFGIVGKRTHAINACVREPVLRCPVCCVRPHIRSRC